MQKKQQEIRFNFGENWENYINKVGAFQITKAIESLDRFGIKINQKNFFRYWKWKWIIFFSSS